MEITNDGMRTTSERLAEQARLAMTTNMHRKWERHAKSSGFSRRSNHNVISIYITVGTFSSKNILQVCMGHFNSFFGVPHSTPPHAPFEAVADKETGGVAGMSLGHLFSWTYILAWEISLNENLESRKIVSEQQGPCCINNRLRLNGMA